MLRVTAKGLNLRAGPGIEYSILGVLPQNRALLLLERGDAWSFVQTFEGVLGWVAHRYTVDDPAPWLTVARGELGVREVPGAGDNPRILEYHRTTLLAASEDAVPWCSSFCNWAFQQVGIPGTGSAAARSWLKWGRAKETPTQGDVVVFRRGAPPAGHVALFINRTSEHIRVLGGNQSNRVCEALYPASDVLGFRAPAWTEAPR